MLAARIDRLTVAPGALALWSLGQAGVVIKAAGAVLYVDPYLTDADGEGGALPRAFPPPIAPQEVTHATAVLLTHDHVDHTDVETLRPLSAASPGAWLAGPPPVRERLLAAGIPEARVQLAEVGRPIALGDVVVTPVPAAHEALDRDAQGRHAYLGYLVEAAGLTVYHAGDTVIHPALLDALQGRRIDVALLPINGRDWFRAARGLVGNMDLREAAELTERLDAGLVVPMHYDLLAFNAADPGHFVSYLRGLNPLRPQALLAPGQLLYVAA